MERLSNVKAVVPRIESPYEATNKALMTKHAALSHQGPAKVKKVKLPPVIHARAKGYVKDIDDEFLKTEADRLERMYKGIASQNPHLFKKKRMKFSHQEREKREADFFHKVDQGMENLKYFRKI